MPDQTAHDADTRRGTTPADPGTNLTAASLTDDDRAALYPTVPADPPAVDLIDRHLLTASHYYGPPSTRRDDARALYAALTADAVQPTNDPDGGPDALRPADWERQAVDAIATALVGWWDYPAGDPIYQHTATRAVRALIDGGLVGPGGRCPQCGATYPRTMPPGEDARCWTCSTADQTPEG